MSKEYVLFNTLNGSVIDTIPVVARSDSFGRDINSEDDMSLTVPLYELDEETRLYWHDYFLEWARGIALVDVAVGKVYAATIITNLTFNVNKETLNVTGKSVKELTRKIRLKGWSERTAPEAEQTFSAATWEQLYQTVLQDCFTNNSAVGANTIPDLLIGWGAVGGTGRRVTSVLFNGDTYGSIMDRIRDELSGNQPDDFDSAGIEWKLEPQFRDANNTKIAFKLVTGTETQPHINRDIVVDVPLVKNSGVKTIEYSVSTNATMAHNKLWVINQIDTGATMTPQWQDDSPQMPLLEEVFDSGTTLTGAQLEAQLSARLKQSEQADFTVTFSKAEDFDLTSITDVGKVYSFVGGSKSAGSGVTARVVGITSNATTGVVRYDLMRLQSRYPVLPKQKRKETLGSKTQPNMGGGFGGTGGLPTGADGYPMGPFNGGGDFSNFPTGDWSSFGDNRILVVNNAETADMIDLDFHNYMSPTEASPEQQGYSGTQLNFADPDISPPYIRFNDSQIEAATVAYKDWIYYLPWNNFDSGIWEQYNGASFDGFTDNWTIIKGKISAEGFMTEREIAGSVGAAGINQLLNRRVTGYKPKHELFTNGVSGDTHLVVDENAEPGFVLKRDFVLSGGDPETWYLNAFIANVTVEMIPWVVNDNLYINQVVTQKYLQFTQRGYATTVRSETNSTLVRYPIDPQTGELGLPITCNTIGGRTPGRTIKPSTQSTVVLHGTNKVVWGSWENVWDYTLAYGMYGTNRNGAQKNVDASSPAGLWTDQDFPVVLDFTNPDGEFTTFPNYQYVVPFLNKFPKVSSYGRQDWVVTDTNNWVDLTDDPIDGTNILRTPALFEYYCTQNGILYCAVNASLGSETFARTWGGIWARPVNDTTWKRVAQTGPNGYLPTHPFMEIDGAIMYDSNFDWENQQIATLNTKFMGWGKRTTVNAKDPNIDAIQQNRINGGITTMHHNVTIWNGQGAHLFRTGSMKPVPAGQSAISTEGLNTLPDFSGLQASSVPTTVALSGPM